MSGRVIIKAALPMLVSNWIFGMGIIEYPPGHKYRAISFIYSSICLSSYCYLAVYFYPHFLSMTNEFTASTAVLKVMLYSQIFLTFGSIVSGWKRCQGISLMLYRMKNADLLLEKIGVTANDSKRFKSQIVVYIARLSFIFIFITINSFSLLSKGTIENADIAVIIMLSYPVVLIFIIDTTFINFVVCASQQFRKLNDTLRKMLTSSEECPQHRRVMIAACSENKILQIEQTNSIEVDITYTLNIAKKAHLELVHLCKEADETFSFHILQTIMVAIAVTTGCLYQIYVLLPCINTDSFNVYRVVLKNGIWVFYYIWKIFIFSKGCSSVTQEATVTGDVISEFYDEPSSTEETRTVIREFHCHLIRNLISFNAYGYIKIDLTLIKVVLSSVTTYLVIFSQFGNFIVPNYNNSTCLEVQI